MKLDKPLTAEEFNVSVGAVVNASMETNAEDGTTTINNEKLVPLLLNLLCDQVSAISKQLEDKPRIVTLS